MDGPPSSIGCRTRTPSSRCNTRCTTSSTAAVPTMTAPAGTRRTTTRSTSLAGSTSRRPIMKQLLAVAVGALLAAGTGAALAQQNPTALAKGVCSACHGPEGHSVSPVFPNLAGQQPAYIILQLEAFRGHVRGDPNAQAYMWGMASQLGDDTIKALADYYAAQKPVPMKALDPALMADGERIYTQGIPTQSVPACASCHGAKAEGAGAFPRLEGQHVDYLVAQLLGFQSGVRSNAPIMLAVVRTLSHEQMKAAATYAASR